MVRPHLDPYNKNTELKNEQCFNLRKQPQETTLVGDKYLFCCVMRREKTIFRAKLLLFWIDRGKFKHTEKLLEHRNNSIKFHQNIFSSHRHFDM